MLRGPCACSLVIWCALLHRSILWMVTQIIKGIERRLSYVTFLPVENGEGLQILRYEARIRS